MKWNKKSKSNIPEPKDELPTNGGNAYVLNQELEAIKEFDYQTIPYTNSRQTTPNFSITLKDMKKNIKKEIEKITPNVWFIMNWEANYFCNLINFYSSSSVYERYIKEVIRCAFFQGRAGIYYMGETKKPIPVVIVNKKVDIYNNPIEYVLQPTSLYLQNLQSNNKTKNSFTIRNDECLNVCEFQWGTQAMGAYVWLFPIILQFHRDLAMINVNTFSYIKKFGYKIFDPSQGAEDIESYFDYLDPLIYYKGDNIESNKITPLEFKNTGNIKDLLEYFKEKRAIYYEWIGRRTNTDIKKERNVTNEVEASQENYDVLHNEFISYFRIFIEELKKFLPVDIKIDLIKEKEESEELGDIDYE